MKTLQTTAFPITAAPSPNFGNRGAYVPEMIVVHCTDGYFPSDMQYLQNPDPGSTVGPVSAHFVVAPSGGIYQLVDTANTAWHAGRVDSPTAVLKPGINPNLYTIGIETSVRATSQMTTAQATSLKALIAELGKQFKIPLDRKHVVGHHEIFAPKTCPGTINVDSLLPAAPVKEESGKAVIAEVTKALDDIQKVLPTLPEKERRTFITQLQEVLMKIARLLANFIK